MPAYPHCATARSKLTGFACLVILSLNPFLSSNARPSLGRQQLYLSASRYLAPPDGQSPYGGMAATVPGLIQIENFDNSGEGVAYHDTTATNDGGSYRWEGVDVCACGSPYGYSTGWTAPGEWMEYTINVTSTSSYRFDLLTATILSNTSVHLEIDGIDVTGQMILPNTGAWHIYALTSKSGVNLTAGQHVLKLSIDAGGFLIDSINVTNEQTPYGGTAAPVPGVIHVENFDNGGEGVAYHDTTTTNDGGLYRSEGVDVCNCGSPYGYSVGWTAAGEWLEYTVNVNSTGSYKFELLTATILSGTAARMSIDGIDVGQMVLPNTGAWHVYATTSQSGVNLTAGTHVLRLSIDSGGFLIDSINVSDDGLPLAPTSLAASTVSTSQINLSWTDNSYNETGFKIERKTGAGGTYAQIATLGANVSSYNNGDLASNTQYYYRVRATNAAGNSGYSNEANATTFNAAPSVRLTAPANGSTYTAPASITLTANASDSDGTIIKVEFFQGTTKLGEDTNGADGYSYNWTDIGAGTYSLTAKGTDNTGAPTTSSGVDVTVSLPTVTVTATDAEALEPGSNTGTFTVSRTGSTGSSLVVNFSVGGTATSGSDYTSIGTSVTIPGGVSSQTVVVTPIDELSVEAIETVTLTLSTNAIYTVGSPSNATINISDNDTYPPTASITQPTSGAVIAASGSVTINSDASDQDGTISKVEFFQNGVKLAEDTAAPYSYTWNNVSAGNYNLTVVATDNANAIGASSAVPIVVNAPPAVSITSPVNNAAFTGSTININASATDSDAGVTKVEFFDGTNKIGEDTSMPYSCQWTNAPEGPHGLTAVATDTYGTTATSSAIQVSIVNFNVAKLDPTNRVGGEDPLSRNFAWGTSLLGLPGRAGLDLGLSLNYNSLVWTKSGSHIAFNDDAGFPSAGFRLGFPVIQPLYYNSVVAKNAYLLISPEGSRTELRQVGTSALYESADSSYVLLDASTMTLRTTDGTQLSYAWQGSEYQCTQIKDRNGNFITINYTTAGRIDTIVDTLARTIKLNYDENNNLTSITQTRIISGQPQTHTWAAFTYADLTIQTNFSGLTLVGIQNGATIKVLSTATLADGSYFDFDYTTWGQVWRVSNYAADNHLLNYRSYNLPLAAGTAQTDCPRFTERREWAENWNRIGSIGPAGLPAGPEQEVVTNYSVPANSSWTLPSGTQQTGTLAQVTQPDGTYHRIYFPGTVGTSTGWQRGMPSLVETYDSTHARQRQSVSTWTQDNTSVPYILNPRIVETNVYDPAGNRARTSVTYQPVGLPDGTSCHLPQDVREYEANAITVLRRTHVEYNLDSTYTNRRIVGLVSEKLIYEGDQGAVKSKVSFQYDESGSIQGSDAPVQHDNTNYGATLVSGRANVSSVKRHDVINTGQFTMSRVRYNTAGAAVASIDPLNHQVAISYADSFSDGNNSRNTLAYLTAMTDADGFTSVIQYSFDFGAVTRTQTPPPEGQTVGAIKHYIYDSIGRTEKVATEFDGNLNYSYTRFVYSAQNRIDTYSTFKDSVTEAHSFQIADGHGRVFATASDHPGSVGGFSGQLVLFDPLGRPIKSSNPTETSANGPPLTWVASGDDASAGWIYRQQGYDWKSRPLVTTNADGTTKEASYSGCGCAGGEVVTLTDEGTVVNGVTKKRQQKIYADVLGRTVKIEILNWDGAGQYGTGGSVYSSVVNVYNPLDQVESVKQYAGAATTDGTCPTSTCQQTSMTYDGFGRQETRHVPEQDAGSVTTYNYNSDNTVSSIVDARGATRTFTYNARHLLTGISYSAPGGIAVPASVSFAYDGAANRTSMTDGIGGASYAYDQLSRMTSETRSFIGLTNGYTLNYNYNPAGELTSFTDPAGAVVNYGYGPTGRLSGVTGSNFANLTTYASNAQYRAWGALKSLCYGNTKTLSIGYNNNLQATTYEVPGVLKKSYEYHTDGRLKFTQDQLGTNSKFDRLYEYDHMVRVVRALTGAEARGGAATDDRPYNETLVYDAMNHLTTLDRRNWDRDDGTDPHTVTNNRVQGFTYDADGRMLIGDTGHYTYDAAGRVSWFGNNDPYHTEQEFTGDGLRAKTTSRRYDEQLDDFVLDKITYYVTSSVLGGKLVTEVSETGAKERTLVHAGGSVIASQKVEASIETVVWEHTDVSGASRRSTTADGLPGGDPALELDAVGAHAGLFKPPTWTAPDKNGLPVPYPGVADMLNNPGGGCTIDRVPIPCDTFNSLLMSGNVNSEYLGLPPIQDPQQDPKARKKQWVPQSAPVNPRAPGIYDIWLPGEFRHDRSEGGLASFVFVYDRNLLALEVEPKNPKTPYVDQNVLNSCTENLFGVTTNSFTGSSKGNNGSFQGTGPSYFRTNKQGAGNNDTFTITNNATSYTSSFLTNLDNQFKVAAGKSPNPPGRTVIGTTNRFSPLTNYTANNLGPMQTLQTQVHELGHSLDVITGIGYDSFEDDLAGKILEDCVKRRGGFRYK